MVAMVKEERYITPVVIVRPPESFQVVVKPEDCIAVEHAENNESLSYRIHVQSGRKKKKKKKGEEEEVFSFQNVYGYGGRSLDRLNEELVQPLLLGCLEGEPGAVIAYGETGSGKSYVSGTQNIATEHAWDGSIGFYICHRLFELERELRLKNMEVECSMIEIYKESRGKEQVFDLLDGFTRTRLSTYAGSKQQHRITTAAALYDKLRHGSMLRNTDRTDGNVRSSRSHAIFTVTISHDKDGKRVRGTFTLVDLAGAESAADASGSQQKQGLGINLGLLALQTVINDVVKQGMSVNYRLSRLTYELRHALGGGTDCDGAACLFLGCISPFTSSSRTATTLEYINGASKIKNIVQQHTLDVGLRKGGGRCQLCASLQKTVDELKQSLDGQGRKAGSLTVISRDEHTDMLKQIERDRARIFALEQVIRESDSNYDKLLEHNRALAMQIEQMKDSCAEDSVSVPITPQVTKPGLAVLSLDPLMSIAESCVEEADQVDAVPVDVLCIPEHDSNLDSAQYKTLYKIIEEDTVKRMDGAEGDDQSVIIQRLVSERSSLLKALKVYNEFLGAAKEERDIAEASHKQCMELLTQAVKEKVQYVELAGQFATALDVSQHDVFELQHEIKSMKISPSSRIDGHAMANLFSRIFFRSRSASGQEESPEVKVSGENSPSPDSDVTDENNEGAVQAIKPHPLVLMDDE